MVWLRRNSEGGRFRPLDEAQSLKLEATWRAGKSEVDLDSEIVSEDSSNGSLNPSILLALALMVAPVLTIHSVLTT